MSTFAELRKKQNRIDDLRSKVEQDNGSNDRKKDDRYWSPTTDDQGNGSAVIRFMPEPPNEDFPWVKLYNRAFQGPSKKWYINNCRTTINEKDPVQEITSKLYDSGIESDKKAASSIKRKLSFVSNVLIVDDPAHPELNGSVKLFRYGKKIKDMLDSAIVPEFAEDKPLNPFDLWEGANFRLKIRQVDGFRNYEKSSFASPSAVPHDDEYLEKLWKTCHSLQDVISADKFKSYDVLKEEMIKVLGPTIGSVSTGALSEDASPAKSGYQPNRKPKATEKAQEDDDVKKEDLFAETPKASAPPKQEEAKKAAPAEALDDDDDAALFARLAKG